MGERSTALCNSSWPPCFTRTARPGTSLPELRLRVQVGPRRYPNPRCRCHAPLRSRVPHRQHRTSHLHRSPLPQDRIHRMQERIDDYVRMGVPHIWLIDPLSRHAWIATHDGSHTRIPEAFAVPGTPIRIVLAEVFAELDDMLTQPSPIPAPAPHPSQNTSR